MEAVLPLLQIVIENLPGAIKTGEELYNLGVKFATTINGQEPTQADKDQLRAQIESDVSLALAPLPAAQPGDPDYVKPV